MEWKQLRDKILFGFGLTGLTVMAAVWVLSGRPPDPTLALLFGGAAGLPTVMRRDERD